MRTIKMLYHIGDVVKIEKVQISDAQEMLKLFECLDSESEFMLYEKNERKTTLEQQKEILSHFVNDKEKLMVVAKDNKIIGFCALVGGVQNRVKHVASLVMGVQKSHWGKGVGSALISLAIEKASQIGITRFELTVHVSNEPAIVLYKKFGFVIEGEKNSSIKLNGVLVNEYSMAKV